MQKFSNEASYVMDNREAATYDEYSELKFICDQSYRTGYVHIHVTYVLQSIENDAFYEELIKYCQSRETTEKNEKRIRLIRTWKTVRKEPKRQNQRMDFRHTTGAAQAQLFRPGCWDIVPMERAQIN